MLFLFVVASVELDWLMIFVVFDFHALTVSHGAGKECATEFRRESPA